MSQNQEKISWDQLPEYMSKGLRRLDICGLSDASASYAAARLLLLQKKTVVMVAHSEKAADRLWEEMALFLKADQQVIYRFPSYNTTAFKPMAFHNETAARRMRALYQIVEARSPTVTITTVPAICQKLLPKRALIQFGELLMVGEEVDRDAIVQKLVAGGYVRTMIVEEHGDFSLRGGILDVHSPLYDDPLRIEFFGDMVESIRLFAADTQRTISHLNEAVLLPAREVILDRAELNSVIGRIRTLAAELGMAVTRVRQIIGQIKTEGIYPGIESLMPVIYPGLETFFDYVPTDTLFLMMEPGQLARAASDFGSVAQRSYESACDRQHLCVPPSQLYLTWPQIDSRLSEFSQWAFKPLSLTSPVDTGQLKQHVLETKTRDRHGLRQLLQQTQTSEKPFQPLYDWLGDQKAAGYTIFLVCRRPSNLDRLVHILSAYNITAAQIEDFTQAVYGQGRIYLIYGIISNGFTWDDAQVSVITDEEVFGTRYRDKKKAKKTRPADLLNFGDLKQDDWVVHAEHGIGQYGGLTKLNLEGVVNDFLLILYQNNDKLYLPVERMTQVQKYMGVEGAAPVMDKMGGKTWDRVKQKIKRKAEKIAGELLKLYAARKVQQGHAFGEADNHFQNFSSPYFFSLHFDVFPPSCVKNIDNISFLPTCRTIFHLYTSSPSCLIIFLITLFKCVWLKCQSGKFPLIDI